MGRWSDGVMGDPRTMKNDKPETGDAEPVNGTTFSHH
jgi:hypothetical protein